MLCRNSDAVPEGHKGQTANLAWWRELHCDRKSSLFASQLGDGNHLHHDRAKEAGSPGSVARGPEKVSLASLPSSPDRRITAHVIQSGETVGSGRWETETRYGFFAEYFLIRSSNSGL